MKKMKVKGVAIGIAGGVAVVVGVICVAFFLAAENSNGNRAKNDEIGLPLTGRNSSDSAQSMGDTQSTGDGQYDYTEAGEHVGEKASVSGTVTRVFTAKSGVTFFDYCSGSGNTCPFSAVIFADDAKTIGNLSQYQGKNLTVMGTIKSYQGRAEMVINNASQIVVE